VGTGAGAGVGVDTDTGAGIDDPALISFKDPLDGPGPPGPADTGIPVSAIVGVTAGKFEGEDSSLAATTAGVVEAGVPGIGAGDWFKP